VLPILLAALSAVVWGAGDFSGGKAAQTSRTLAVTVLSQLAGLPVLAACVALLGTGPPRIGTLAVGTVAGLAGFVGILLLYQGLSTGAMAVFAPVSGVTTALVPVIVGLVLDRTPSTVALIGVGCAVAAIGLVSASPGAARVATPRIVGLALASGVCFGIFFAILGKAGPAAGLWPLVGVRLGSLGAGLVAVAVTRTPLRLGTAGRRWSLIAGPLDVSANVLYAVAAMHGPLAVVAPISALYPVSTVLLAIGIDRERVGAAQLAGLGLAATALVLVAT
jgi:drug/metabolite transporter (DMT)-like permease